MPLDIPSLGEQLKAPASRPPLSPVCAVVVAYFPDERFRERIAVVLAQVPLVIVVDNTPRSDLRGELGELGTRVRVIENGSNLGIASALNTGLRLAEEMGYRWLLTLDQDTECDHDMVETLLEVKAACVADFAVIGSNYRDPRNDRKTKEDNAFPQWQERKTVITSGSLIDVAKAISAGGFREDFFIDQVDHEFCLRMRRCGYRIGITRKVIMSHSVGKADGAYIPFIGTFPNHPPIRKYYITRNSLVTIGCYWRYDPDWCARRLARLLFGFLLLATLEHDRRAKIRAYFAGIRDAILKRMGACQLDDLYRPDS